MFDFINKLKADRAERKAEAELRASLELECKKIKEEQIKEEQRRQYKEFVEKQKKRPIEDLLVDIYITEASHRSNERKDRFLVRGIGKSYFYSR